MNNFEVVKKKLSDKQLEALSVGEDITIHIETKDKKIIAIILQTS